jgi:stress response protein YsnF
MSTSIIGLFENNDIARKVVSALTEAGCQEDAIKTLGEAGVSEAAKQLVEAGYEKDKARRYGDALRQGGALIVAEVDDDKAEKALGTMRRFGVLSPEALIGRTGSQKSEETATAQVIEEELEVGKTQVTGGKRLTTSVSERQVQETVTLREDTVEVERTRADRTLNPEEADKAFHEDTIELNAVSEKPVVSKQAHVVEEVALSKHSGEREVTVSGTVRRQDVKVEEIDRKTTGSRKS